VRTPLQTSVTKAARSLVAGLLACTVVFAASGLNGALAAPAGAKASSTHKASRAAPAKSKGKARVSQRIKRNVAPPRPSFGQMYGLHATDDALDLKSSVALVVDQDTDEVLFSKNPQAVLPIASITKLMAALVLTEAALPLDETLVVSREDVAATTTSGARSRLAEGTRLTRGELLHLALMSSENRATHALGRTYPGGVDRFVSDMNAKARELGMQDTRYVEPTGLSSNNQSSAQDLARLVRAASSVPIIRELSTSLDAAVAVGRRVVQYRNTNGLVRNPEWDIGLQKTGYISAAGRCVVMQTQLAGRKLIMVLLDSAGRYSRIGDAERLRGWLRTSVSPAPAAPARVAPVSIVPVTAAPAAALPAAAPQAPTAPAPTAPAPATTAAAAAAVEPEAAQPR
jgi:D-alanyl-D-alanine endopeptidase (penicillin-binding protein 7)